MLAVDTTLWVGDDALDDMVSGYNDRMINHDSGRLYQSLGVAVEPCGD